MKVKKKNRQETSRPAAKNNIVVYLLLLVLVPAVLYFRVVNFEFSTFDDSQIISSHYDTIGNIKKIFQAFTHDAFMNKAGAQFYRPMQTISFMIDAQLGGKEAWIYHLSNLIWHILVVIAIFFFLKKIGIKKEISFLLALLFSIHPLFANAVAWIPARGDILLCFFSLLSFITILEYFDTRKTIYIFLHALVFLPAVFSKETVALLPVLILIYVYFTQRRKFILKDITPFIAIWCFSFVLFYFLRQFLLKASLPSEYFGIIPFIQNLPFIPIILGKFFLPYNLNTMPFFDNKNLIAGVILLLFLIVLTYKVIKRERRIVIWGGIWFLAFSVPAMFLRSYISDIGYEYFDYRGYIPIIGILIIAGFIINELTAGVTFKKILIISIPILLVYSIVTYNYSGVFADPISFFTSAIKASSNNAMAYNSRGCIYMDNGRTEDAIADFDNSIKASPTYSIPYNNKGLLYRSTGDNARAEYYLSLAINYDTLYAKANQEFSYINLSSVKLSLKKYEEVILLVKKGIGKYPDNRSLHNNLGLAYYYTAKFDSAKIEYNRAIQSGTESFMYYNNRGKAEFRLNQFTDAINDFNKALEFKPDFGDSYFYRGLSKMNLNKFEEAISDFNMVISLNSRSGEAYYFRGFAYYRLNKQAEAMDNLNKSLELGYKGKPYSG